jgi:inhibitor of cysteine peptidase
MNTSIPIISFGILCIAAILFAGCTSPGIPLSEKAIQEPNIVVTEQQNGATVYVNQSTIIMVELAENPTTGFMWNMTVTPGLHIMNDTFVPSDTSGKLVGSGGTHSWEISAVGTGNQAITAVYSRPWEPDTGNATAFLLNVVVA